MSKADSLKENIACRVFSKYSVPFQKHADDAEIIV